MTWRERIAEAWDYPRIKEDLAAAQAELVDNQVECAQLEDRCTHLEKRCEELNGARLELSGTLKNTRQKMEALRAALLSFCPSLDSTEKLRQFYTSVAPQYDPEGFRLYYAAQEITGIGSLHDYFPYEDARGYFEEADGHTLLRYLTAVRFGAVEWDIVPGTTYEAATLREVDTATPEYLAFEKQMYANALERMGFQEFLPTISDKARAQTKQRTESR